MTPLHLNIRSIRDRKRLTQEYMAEQLGISLKTYNEWETGKTPIRTDKLEKIAKILNTSPEAIYTYEDSFTQHNSFHEQHSNGVFIQHSTSDAEKALYEQLLAEKDKRIATLEEMVALLKFK
jgi:transcriptional regulator with XRE-family HTH domain